MADSLRILSIGAHPADIFDQSGGTMAHHTARGDWVGCVVLTHGARVHDAVISDQMFHIDEVPDAKTLTDMMQERSDLKAEEVKTACRALGVEDVYFFGADDAVLLPDEPTVRRLARLLRELKPDIILTHFPDEGGGVWNAHAVSGRIVMMALGLAGSVDPGDRNPPHRVMQVFYWGCGAAAIPKTVWNARGGYYNDVFIDITDVVEKKLAALDALESQGYGGAYARKRIETSDGAFGTAGGVSYAEGFISLNAETHYHLPVSDYARQMARESDHERMRRYSYKIGTDT
jgi:LmbE family N-acetylglucosaminyl deacetylase